jgi:hypothetical protein
MNKQLTIFVLEVIFREGEWQCSIEGVMELKAPVYPHRIEKQIIGYYSSLLMAESVMRRDIGEYGHFYFKDDDFKRLFGFLVTEYKIDETECWNDAETRRSYLADGSPNDKCLVCERRNAYTKKWNCTHYEWIYDKSARFRGRTKQDIHFKDGDIVEVMTGNMVKLAVVAGLPASRSYAAKCPWHQYGHAHDCYLTLELSDDKMHIKQNNPQCLYVFPLRQSVSEETVSALKEAHNTFFGYKLPQNK